MGTLWGHPTPPALTQPSSPGEEEEEEDGREERLPSCFDDVMHFLTVFWKVLFACVPPTEYCNGWACFGVSILLIGVLTALIGDLAAHFGCTVGLKDSVNAVVFVALGTSIPGVWGRGGAVGAMGTRWVRWGQRGTGSHGGDGAMGTMGVVEVMGTRG